jgi:hexosaminidase
MYRRLIPTSIELESLGLTHLESEDAGLRELAGAEQIDALRTFASAFEPVSFGERANAQHTDQLTALDNFVDAVRPDPPSRHWFELAAKRLIADPKGDPTDRIALAAWFTQLSETLPAVRRLMANSPRLAELSLRADQLLQLTEMGQQALQYVVSGQRAPAGWKASQIDMLDQVNKPSALVRFDFLSPMRDIVKAVAE